jgi:hypothetical protein
MSTTAQRLAFFTGHQRRSHKPPPLTKLPLDIVRRILTRYKVAQGRRKWLFGNFFLFKITLFFFFFFFFLSFLSFLLPVLVYFAVESRPEPGSFCPLPLRYFN